VSCRRCSPSLIAADHCPNPAAIRARACASVSASWPASDPSGQPPLRPGLISNYVADVLSKLLGRTITYQELTFEENKDAMIRAGVPAPIAEMNAQAFSLTAGGDAEWVTEDVPSLLGRPARSFGQFAADYAAAFSWGGRINDSFLTLRGIRWT
jgi:hypothetical protein